MRYIQHNWSYTCFNLSLNHWLIQAIRHSDSTVLVLSANLDGDTAKVSEYDTRPPNSDYHPQRFNKLPSVVQMGVRAFLYSGKFRCGCACCKLAGPVDKGPVSTDTTKAGS